MKQLIYTILLVLLFQSCTNSDLDTKPGRISIDTDSQNLVVRNFKDSALSYPKISDSTIQMPQIPTPLTKKKTEKITQENQPLEYARFIEFPSDKNMNGEPMKQQIEMPIQVYKNSPDTLLHLALFRYKGYDQFFPTSIADNFEEGISTESIHYPKKLIFRFELFENEYAAKPYLTKDIIIKRNNTGEPYAE